MHDKILRDRILWLIVAIYLALATLWNFLVPLFESPDEPAHVQYVYFLSTHSRLPDLKTESNEAGIESPQPPLYYAIGAWVLHLMGNPPIATTMRFDPKFSTPAFSGAARRLLPLDQPAYPIRALRAVSSGFGVISILMTFALAFELTRNRSLARGAACLTAFLPQFTFISASVNNDNAAVASGAAAMYAIVRIAQPASVRSRVWFIAGVVIGIALLAKASLLVLLPTLALAMLRRVDRATRVWLANIAVCTAGIVLTSGWLFARNLILYGNAVNVEVWLELAPGIIPLRVPELTYYLNPFPQLLMRSYFGVFGWLNFFCLNQCTLLLPRLH